MTVDEIMVEGAVGLAEKAGEFAFRLIANATLSAEAKAAYLARLPARLDATNAEVQAAPVFDPDAPRRPTGPPDPATGFESLPDPGPTAPGGG